MSLRDSIGGIAKLVVNVHDSKLQAELLTALLTAQNEALALQERVAKLQEENADLREQVRSNKQTSELAEQLFYARNAYWRKDESILSAYCTICWDTKSLLVRMQMGQDDAYCNACKTRHWGANPDGRRPTPTA